jgi:hypothetical protein
MKAEFGAGTTGEMTNNELISKLERINPGIRAWATRFAR